MRDKNRKKYAWLDGFLSNVLGGERKYTFNKVTYIVEPRFRSVNEDKVTMPQEKFARMIEKSAAHLQTAPNNDKIKAEYVLDSAGKEEYADQNQTK